ncbi:AmmeMemoRadiSam system protein B [Patescibacteria group bacterium]
MLTFASIVPHPPIIIPTIGKLDDLKTVSKTIHAMERLTKEFAKTKTQTLIVVSPHGPIEASQFSIVESPTLAGHFYNFGDFETEFLFRNDENLIGLIRKECQKESLPLKIINNIKELDHGTLVPLCYLLKGLPNLKIVPLTYSFLDQHSHFNFGKKLKEAINQSNGKIGIIASGDLSHRLAPDAPADYSPQGKEFDEKIIQFLEKKDVGKILNIDPGLIKEAGECGYRSIITLLGALDNINWEPETLSYESPFGVGYLVFNFKLF